MRRPVCIHGFTGHCNYCQAERTAQQPLSDKQRKECKFWKNGTCSKGNQCTFSHSTLPNTIHSDTNRTECKFWKQNGTCSKGNKCTFSHSTLPNTIHSDTKRTECVSWEKAGTCSKGNKCSFSHAKVPQSSRDKWEKEKCDLYSHNEDYENSLSDVKNKKNKKGACQYGKKCHNENCNFSHDQFDQYTLISSFSVEEIVFRFQILKFETNGIGKTAKIEILQIILTRKDYLDLKYEGMNILGVAKAIFGTNCFIRPGEIDERKPFVIVVVTQTMGKEQHLEFQCLEHIQWAQREGTVSKSFVDIVNTLPPIQGLETMNAFEEWLKNAREVLQNANLLQKISKSQYHLQKQYHKYEGQILLMSGWENSVLTFDDNSIPHYIPCESGDWKEQKFEILTKEFPGLRIFQNIVTEWMMKIYFENSPSNLNSIKILAAISFCSRLCNWQGDTSHTFVLLILFLKTRKRRNLKNGPYNE